VLLLNQIIINQIQFGLQIQVLRNHIAVPQNNAVDDVDQRNTSLAPDAFITSNDKNDTANHTRDQPHLISR